MAESKKHSQVPHMPDHISGHVPELTQLPLATYITQRRIGLLNFVFMLSRNGCALYSFTIQRRRDWGKSCKIQWEYFVRAFRFSWVKLGWILRSYGYSSRLEPDGSMPSYTPPWQRSAVPHQLCVCVCVCVCVYLILTTWCSSVTSCKWQC